MPHKHAIATIATALLAGLSVVFAPVSSAAPSAPPAEGEGSLLLIMDVSGSMQRQDASGTTLIAGARQAVRKVVESVPAETPIGLRLYGSEYAGDNESVGCRDTELAVPIGPAGSAGPDITAAIDAAEPTGFTPIGYSLVQAAEDFPAEGARSVVLVSDGEDTCGAPDPCAAAKRLAADGIDIRVDTVGLFLEGNPKAQRQLECVAKATGGTYVSADDAAELVDGLDTVSGRAVQRFEADGAEIDGGPAQSEPAPIEPGEAYVDDVVNPESRWYSFEATEGQPLVVTVTDDGSKEYGCCLTVGLYAPDGTRIGSANGFSDGVANTYRVETFDDGARDTGTFTVGVVLDDTTSTDGDYGAVEYQLTVEAGEVLPSESPSALPTEPTPTAEQEAPAESEGAAAEDDHDDDNTVLWVVIGLLVALLLAMGVALALLWRRVGRDKPSGPSGPTGPPPSGPPPHPSAAG